MVGLKGLTVLLVDPGLLDHLSNAVFDFKDSPSGSRFTLGRLLNTRSCNSAIQVRPLAAHEHGLFIVDRCGCTLAGDTLMGDIFYDNLHAIGVLVRVQDCCGD